MFHPAPSDSFIGRSRELAELAALFSGGQRVVTLLGPPGVGKTRLGLEYLRRCAAPDGAHGAHALFCPLADARDVRALCAAVLRALGAPSPTRAGRHAGATIESVGAALGGRGPLLLVLDNCEQLVDAAAPAITAWLAAAGALRVLATSRERLRIIGEAAYEVPPLALPANETERRSADAVVLFIERARAVRPSFAVQDAKLPILERIVHKLDGLPLAIELAAARAGMLSLDELDARLPHALDVLGRGQRDAPPRQATMRGAVQWSWDLLSAHERLALMGCAVFRGGFSVSSAEAVLANGDSQLAREHVLDLVHSLRDKSLIHDATHERAGDEPERRFDLYVGIREFALEQAASDGLAPALTARHAGHFALEGGRRAARFEQTGELPELAWLIAERDNLLEAYTCAWTDNQTRAADDARAALTLAVALAPVLLTHGPLELLSELVGQVLAHPSALGLEPELRARALGARAEALQLQGALDDAQRELERALAAASSEPRGALLARLLSQLGVLQHRRRQSAAARDCYERAHELYSELGDVRQQARALGNLGALCHDFADFDGAGRYYAEALARFRHLAEPRWEGIFLTNRAILEQERGRHEAARADYVRALGRLKQAGDKRLLGITLGNLGVLAHECGDLEEALGLHVQAQAELRQLGDTQSEALCLARLAALHAARGQLSRAEVVFEEAERTLGGSCDALSAAAIDLNRAFLDLATGKADGLERAQQRLSAAERPLPGEDRSAADMSDDVRSTLRILRSRLNETEPLQRALKQLPGDALLIGPDALWFRPPNGSIQDLRKYTVARRLLDSLVRHHATATGTSLPLEVLREAGWPNERIESHAAANRVHVALADLRKRGLKTWLKRSTEGYALSPELRIEHVALELPASSGNVSYKAPRRCE